MRLDLFLKLTRIIKQRTLAKQACDSGAVTVNGATVKPGVAVQQGDRLRIDLPSYFVEAEVLEVPQRGNVPRGAIERYIRILHRQTKDPSSYVFGKEDAPAPPGEKPLPDGHTGEGGQEG